MDGSRTLLSYLLRTWGELETVVGVLWGVVAVITPLLIMFSFSRRWDYILSFKHMEFALLTGKMRLRWPLVIIIHTFMFHTAERLTIFELIRFFTCLVDMLGSLSSWLCRQRQHLSILIAHTYTDTTAISLGLSSHTLRRLLTVQVGIFMERIALVIQEFSLYMFGLAAFSGISVSDSYQAIIMSVLNVSLTIQILAITAVACASTNLVLRT